LIVVAIVTAAAIKRARKMDLITFGSYVALGLAALKVAEFFRDRKPKISVVRMLRGSSEVGNDLLLTNASKVPAAIYYYELIWLKPSLLTKYLGLRRKHMSYEFSLADELCNISIDGYSHSILNFSDQDHFDWGDDLTNDLYLSISMVGRGRPLWLWIAGPETRIDRIKTYVNEKILGLQ
jgi:hypothetical protein